MFHVDDAGDRVRVKICGITNVADALTAIEAGADALGVNLFPGSKRYVQLAEATSWLGDLPRAVRTVALLVDPTFEEAKGVAALGVFDALQLHGSETPAFCERLRAAGVQFAKAVPVVDGSSLAALPSYGTRTLVLDSQSAAGFGGSGRPFPWQLAAAFRDAHPEIRVVLAGGLTSENVAEAVKIVRPFAVDVTTGVEAAPGRKDAGLLRAFVAAARA